MLTFQRLGGTTLYLGAPSDASTPGSPGPVVLALPAQTPTPPATLSMEQAWNFQHPTLGAGYLLFFDDGVDIAGLSFEQAQALAERLHQLLPRVVRNQHLSLGWVMGVPATPSTLRIQTLTMVRSGAGAQTANLPQAIRFQQLEVMVLPGTPFERGGAGLLLQNTEYMAPPGADPRMDQPTKRRIYLRGAAAYDLDKVGDTVEIPLVGETRGGLLFDLHELAGIDIDAGIMDVAMYYVVPEPELGRDQSLRYPLLNLTSPTGAAQQTRAFNLKARLYPASELKSIFDFGNNNQADGPVIQSYFATYHGYPVHLIPLAGAGLQFTHVPNPGVYPSRAAEVRTHLSLTPVGTFELLVDDPDPEGDWLRGGSSGSEFVSFQSRAGSQRGDVLVFYRGQNGYAPEFDAQGSSLQQAELDLLTNRFKTSWVMVGHHPDVTPNGRYNQYYAQPDDNVLHSQQNGDDYLDPVEVAAADLPRLSHDPQADALFSFPLTPLNGVIAPDERISPPIGMDKYVIFEKEIMSPLRKNRVSVNKLSAIATNQGRGLLTSHTIHATTPQGMLVEVEGNDWQALTLAYDGVDNLVIDDIADEFQDALQSNRLFMVASLPDTLTEDDAQLFTQNKVEITEWPFRLEVGKVPLGLPVGTGLHRYNNVVIFKFIDETFEDIADDIRRWANPDQFNADPADVAAWIKEVIADARIKAQTAATKGLYEPLVDGVLDNPNWTGVLALNVTIPLGEMPCEVKGLLGGIKDWSTFKAHHLGFAISKVAPDATSIEQSSIFALLDYTDPGESNPDNPTYDFRVDKLQVRFANTEIADFDAEIAVIMNVLFDEAVNAAASTNTLKLKGSYEVNNGVPSYSFGSSSSVAFKLMSTGSGLSLIDTVTFTKSQFATSSCPEDDTTPVKSRFSFWGNFTFRLNANFDFFSFDKLEFADLSLNMEYFFVDGIPDLPATFAFVPGNLRFNVAASRTRQDSLLGNFPLRLKGFHYAGDGLDIKKMGYFDIPGLIPGWSGAATPKYALDFTLDMGPLASSSSKKVPTAAIDLIAAWEPSSEGGGVTFGIAIGRNKDGRMELGIEGVFVLSIQGFGFQKLPPPEGGEGHVYAFFLKSAFVKVLNTQIPPGGTFSLVLFVPYDGGNKPNLKNLGWFVAYKSGTGSSGASPQPPEQFDIKITAVTLSATEVAPNSVTPVTVTVKLQNNSNPAQPKPPEEITVSVKAIAVDPTDSRPLPPTPPKQVITLAQGAQTLDTASGNTPAHPTFSWPPKMAGKYKFTATATIKGDMNPGDNTLDSGVVTVKEDPGKKDEKRSIVQLDYLGLGQRVKIPGLTPTALAALTTVEAVIKEMDAKVVPNAPAPIGGDPTASNAALAKILGDIYSPDGGWLIGIDITLFEVVRVALVFAQDNNMYGALLGFAKKAPSFIRGFQIQVLYKKITDELGVYHIVVKLPDSLRQFNIGAAAITLPTIGLDIYTNGDFKIDLGFPYNADFSKSFGIQAQAGPVPIIGYAGFYFAKLSGPTSTKAPKLKPYNPDPATRTDDEGDGKFDPVLEFGLGLSLGIGKTIEKGPLRAGVSVSIVVILEGAVGYYQVAGEEASSAPVFTQTPDWYWVKGQAGLQAMLYGVVDFGIIKAGIEVTATALFTFLVEAYKDTVLGLSLSVSVKVTVVIGSFKVFGKRIEIKVSFSFSATFAFDFTIKNPKVGQEPWNSNLLSAPLGGRSLMQSSNGPATAIDWDADVPAFASRQAVNLTFSPQMTIGGSPSKPRAVASLTLLHGNDNLGGFDPLLEGLIRWAIYLDKGSSASGDSTTVSHEDLLYLNERLHVPVSLSRPANGETPLDYDTIKDFLSENFTIRIHPVSAYTEDDAPQVDGTVFAMIPELEIAVTGDSVLASNFTRKFSAFNPDKDWTYQDDLKEYFDSLLVDVEHKSNIFTTSRTLQQAGGPQVSMATLVFQDYFAFLVQTGIDRAAQYVADHVPSGSTTLGALISGMKSQNVFRTISSMTSRYFLHGLRLPVTLTGNHVSDSLSAEALYALTGQQVEVNLSPPIPPGDDEDDPTPVNWELDLRIGDAGSFVTIHEDDDLALVIERDGEAESEFDALASSQISIGPVTVNRIPSIADQPKRFAFKNPTPLEQVTGDTTVASGTLYPLADTLLGLFAHKGVPGDLAAWNKPEESENPRVSVDGRASLRIEFTARRVSRSVSVAADSEADLFLPNVYQIGGMSEGSRNLVGKLIAQLESGPNPIHDLRLYYEIYGKSDAIVLGQKTNAGDPANEGPDVLLMKTNLSTISAPQDGASLLELHPIADDYSAAMVNSQAQDFLRLLWEASIVNAPGYYLYYADGSDGLPEDIFGGTANEGHITLLVTFTSFQAFANNYLIDNASFEEGDFYLESLSEKKWAPALAPGALAFELSRPNPELVSGADLETLFNLLSYQIVDGTHFGASMRGLPVGPTDYSEDAVPANWTYRQGIRVYPFAKNVSVPIGASSVSIVGEANNTYNGTGGSIDLGFEFLDVYGNVVDVTFTGGEPALTNEPIRYYDPIIGVNQWPSITTSYVFNPNGTSQGDLIVTLEFDDSDYLGPDDGERVISATEAYLRIAEQLGGPGVSVNLSTSVAPHRAPQNVMSALNAAGTGFVNRVLAFLQNPNLTPPVPKISATLVMPGITLEQRNSNADNIFPVTVEVAVERLADLVDSQALTNMPEARRSATIISPEAVAGGGNDQTPESQTMALKEFADDFEDAFPELKVATGLGEQGPNTVWAIRMGSIAGGDPGITYSINGSSPAFFAPAPLSNTLMQREDVLIYPVDGVNNPVEETFTNVDMDIWGRDFLSAVDRFLTADIAVTARKVNPNDYKRIISAKEALAAGISLGVTNVLADTPANGSYLASAQEAYEQALLTRLLSAYEVETAVVYPVTTSNSDTPAGPNEYAPRLFGNIKGVPVIQTGADFSFSTAKVELSGAADAKFSFLFSADRPDDFASALVDLQYRITHVEHDIQDAENGYQASSWLTLVEPIDYPEFTNVDIPVALREFPVPPSLVGQQAVAQNLESTTLSEATLWQYLYTYEQRSVAQDTIFTNVKFNVGPAVTNSFLQSHEPDLFDWLARFTREYPVLKVNLDKVLVGYNEMSVQDRSDASGAIAWLATLVDGVASTWGDWVTGGVHTHSLQQAALEEFTWDFDLTERLIGQNALIEMRILPDSHASTRFPRIQVQNQNGDPEILNPVQNGNLATYSHPWPDSELPDFLERTQIFGDLDVLHTENAWGGISLARNLNLTAPDHDERATNPKFIYETPEVRFVNKVTPLIDSKSAIDISGGNTRSLEDHLTALVNQLFGSAVGATNPQDRLIKIGVRYAYDVRGQGGPAIGPGQTDEFQAYLPVTQRMPFNVPPNNMGAFIGGLTAAMNDWLAETNPIRSRGFYEFDISVFAALSSTDLPVLRLRRLWLGLDKIS